MQKINICIDVALGLDYLHNRVAEKHRVIHRDIKSSNILLDHNWKGMISDLGLSKVGRVNEKDTFLVTDACGTLGYCDPVYIQTGVLTKESDVYSFGVILFEVLCGKLCFIEVDDKRGYLAHYAKDYYKEDKLHEIIDPLVAEQLYPGSLKEISYIAYQCLHRDREKRPSMDLVVKRLKQALEAPEKYIHNNCDEYNEPISKSASLPGLAYMT
ncbi:calmodulin-binding receptor-like cytoplasmic kinase 3 [Bidens hawaiensis]|uniref:calmodulin-binding receptor-like cytoplasmic kinase 3 n=1 Tax=Bidens hawaiensis TaxID=980011 RepID=UPI00404B2F1A